MFWQVGSSATIGTGTVFVGTILALTSITLQTGASVDGRALARNGAVTMDNNHIAVPTCMTDAGAIDSGIVDSVASIDSGVGADSWSTALDSGGVGDSSGSSDTGSSADTAGAADSGGSSDTATGADSGGGGGDDAGAKDETAPCDQQEGDCF